MSLPIGTVTTLSFRLTFKKYLKHVKGQYYRIKKGYRIKHGDFYYYILVPTICEELNIVSVDILVIDPAYDHQIACVIPELKAFLEKVTGNFFQFEKYEATEA